MLSGQGHRRRRSRAVGPRGQELQPAPRERGPDLEAAARHPGRQARDRAAAARDGQAGRDRRRPEARRARGPRARHDRAAAPVGRVDLASHRAGQDVARARAVADRAARGVAVAAGSGETERLNVVDLAAELIAFPTQQAGADGKAGTERPICEHLAALLRARRADDVIVGSAPRSEGGEGAYVFARWGTPRRVINIHVDTVPANAGWSRDPWQPHVADGKLYGLGSADTKGAIAATLVALAARAPRDVGVLFSGDEEHGSAVMHAFLESPHAKPIREAIVCEPTARAAGIAHRGVLGQRATLLGPGGHSSKADHLPKPLATLARLAVAL